jgi:hypothetical protein
MSALFLTALPKWKQYAYSVLSIFIVSAMCFALAGMIGYRFVGFILLFVVSLLAITFDIYPVLLSAAIYHSYQHERRHYSPGAVFYYCDDQRSANKQDQACGKNSQDQGRKSKQC